MVVEEEEQERSGLGFQSGTSQLGGNGGAGIASDISGTRLHTQEEVVAVHFLLQHLLV
jgi:hypothetical protein